MYITRLPSFYLKISPVGFFGETFAYFTGFLIGRNYYQRKLMNPKPTFKELDRKVQIVVVLLYIPVMLYKFAQTELFNKLYNMAFIPLAIILLILAAGVEYNMVHYP